jgi:hypothetical protein
MDAHEFLGRWETFYVITGSAAAALIGLQFVVMALINDRGEDASLQTIDAFGTPTVVHFYAVLALAAIVAAPWHRLTSAALMFGLSGLLGEGYTLIVIRRARHQTGYDPVLEDWIWHAILPVVAYTILIVAAFTYGAVPEDSLFAVGGSAMLLLSIGIHNAWDTVTYVAVGRREELRKAGQEH